MELMMAFCIAGIMICLGVAVRAKVKPVREMLIPATVVGGTIGCILMNIFKKQAAGLGVSSSLFTTIVGYLYIISYIAIGLTKSEKKRITDEAGEKAGKNIVKASFGISVTWNVILSVQAVVGILIAFLVGGSYKMNPMYGILIPFGFCEGPGSAATYGLLFEKYGWTDAAAVAVTFAVVGFVCAFVVGVPLAKFGIKKKIARHAGKVGDSVTKGFYPPEEQRETMGKVTMHAGSLETLSFHFALIMGCYILALGLAKLFSFIPGFIGDSLSGLVYVCGMIVAFIVRKAMDKLKISYVINDLLLTKITGMITDFLIVLAFMAVEFSTVKKWMVPILIECVIVCAITFFICYFFGSRLGGENDFERTLGVFGAATGTTLNGIALIRMVDPKMKTSSIMELGLMSFPAAVYLAVASTFILGYASGAYSTGMMILIQAALVIGIVIAAYVTGCFGKKTYGFSKKWIEKNNQELEKQKEVSLKAKLNIP